MNKKKVTSIRNEIIGLSVLVVVVTLLGSFCANVNFGLSAVYFSTSFLVVAILFFFLKKRATHKILWTYACCYFLLSIALFCIVSYNIIASNGEVVMVLLLLPTVQLYVFPFFVCAAIVTEIVLRYNKKKEKVDF
jgi:TRAP-type C4-dicarboxylate transport system permease small subunit